MKVTGEAMIFRNAHESRDGTWYTYATGVSSKRQDGTWINGYLDVRFKKGVSVENKTKINIEDGFLTTREFTVNGGEKRTKLELMVLKFSLADGSGGFASQQNQQTSSFDSAPTQYDAPGFTAMSEDECPF